MFCKPTTRARVHRVSAHCLGVFISKPLIYILPKMLNLVFTKHLLFVIHNFKIKGTPQNGDPNL